MLIGIDASRAFVKERTGTENYSYQLIKAIAKIDRKNKYILYTRPFLSSRAKSRDLSQIKSDEKDSSTQDAKRPFGRNDNFEIKPINFPRLWTQIGLAKEVLFNPPDVLFIPAHTLPVIRRPGLKTVVTIHDLGYEYLPEYHQFPHKLYLNKSTEYAVKNATHLIAVSQATKNDLINKMGCPKEKITVIYEGYDQNKFKIQSSKFKTHKLPKLLKSLKITKSYILFVGTLQPRKNIERLIEAFSIVCHCEPRRHVGAWQSRQIEIASSSLDKLGTPRNDDRVDLVIAGNKGWFYDDILSAPKRFGVEDRVKFLGYTKEDDLPKLYQNALCFCLPSLFEGFGLPVLEAMACACPVVVSTTSSLPEVAGEAGIYVNPLDVKDIAQKLKLIIENGKLRRELSKKSLKQAQKFSWEKCARETIKVLTSLSS